MAKTLVIKLGETVNNDSLRGLGEFQMEVYSTGLSKQTFKISCDETITLGIIGEGSFISNSAKALSLSAGDHTVEVSNGDYTLSIKNKYAVTALELFNNWDARKFSFNLSELNNMNRLKRLNTLYTKASGDVSAIAEAVDMTYLHISDTRITGNLSSLAGMTKMTDFFMEDTNVKGNFSTLSGLTEMETLELVNVRFSGSISDLSGMTKLKTVTLNNALHGGNISSLINLTNLTSLKITNGYSISGATSSLAALHPNNGGKLATFTYEGTSITGSWPPA